jgi:purine nucleosidase
MGGAFRERGNVTEFAEFNVYNDPEALQVVLDAASRNSIDTTVIPAEVCRQVVLTLQDVERIKAKGLLPNIEAIVEPFIDYYMNNKTHGGFDGAVLYDVLVPLYYQHPELFTVESVDIAVELDGPKRGLTTCRSTVGSTIKLCSDIRADEAKQLVMQSLA